jgi:hypothetical protein
LTSTICIDPGCHIGVAGVRDVRRDQAPAEQSVIIAGMIEQVTQAAEISRLDASFYDAPS